jgi:hypothetical protein
MNNDERTEILNVLAELWTLSPDVRLGQLFAHLGFLGEAHLDKGLGYIEDDELLAVMYRHRLELAARLQGSAVPLLGPAETSVSGSPIQPEAARP